MSERDCESASHTGNSDMSDSIDRLVAGRDVVDIVVCDVSDRQLYGCRNRQRLSGELAQAAEAADCEADVYQSVYWFTVAYMPVVPLGTYLVMPRHMRDDHTDDACRFRAVRVPSDRGQIAMHYIIATLILAFTFTVIVCTVVFR